MASVNLEDNSSSDESKEPPHILYTEEFCDKALQTRGILWVTSLPPVESSPVRLSISDDEKQQKLKCVNILWKHAPQQSRLYSQHCTLQTGNNGKATRFVCGREQTIFYKQFKSLHGFHLFGHVVRPAKMKQFWLKAQRFMNLYQERRLWLMIQYSLLYKNIWIMPRPFWQKNKRAHVKKYSCTQGKVIRKNTVLPWNLGGRNRKRPILISEGTLHQQICFEWEVYMNVESVLNAEVVEKLSYTDGMMKETEICTFGLLLYTQ